MVSKQVRAKRTSKPQNDAARTVWLAGLGAVSIAQKQGGRLVETLVSEGEQFRARSGRFVSAVSRDAQRQAKIVRDRVGMVRGQIVGYIGPVQQRATQAARRIEKQVGTRLDSLLARIGVPAKSKARTLIARGTRTSKAKRPVARAKRK
jgi:poly(hydroxyalkanoate) granule-associated protein